MEYNFPTSSTLNRMYVKRHYNKRWEKKIQPQLLSRKPLLEEPVVKELLEEQGFVFNAEKDNKSVTSPQDLFSALEFYAKKISFDYDFESYEKAWAMTFKTFAKPKGVDFLIPLSLEEVSECVHLDKSSGFPLFTSKRDAMEADLIRAHDLIEKDSCPQPCVSYYRVQHGEEGPKTRLVWGFPLSQTLVEGIFAKPLIDQFLSMNSPMAFGLHKCGIGVKLKGPNSCDYQYSFDFSKFDSSISHRLIHRAFEVLKTWFPDNPIWKEIINYFIFTPIVMPDGNLYRKQRGVPSGSWFTQIIDSIVNYFAIQYGLIQTMGYGVSNDKILVLGDDSIVGLPSTLDLDELADQLRLIGLNLSVTKTWVAKNGKDVHFLGHIWNYGVPNRPLRDVAIRMVYPERWMKVKYRSKERAKYRMNAYISDAISTYQIIRRLPWNRTMDVSAMGIQARTLPSVTGWQQFLESLDPEQDLSTPLDVFYLGVLY